MGEDCNAVDMVGWLQRLESATTWKAVAVWNYKSYPSPTLSRVLSDPTNKLLSSHTHHTLWLQLPNNEQWIRLCVKSHKFNWWLTGTIIQYSNNSVNYRLTESWITALVTDMQQAMHTFHCYSLRELPRVIIIFHHKLHSVKVTNNVSIKPNSPCNNLWNVTVHCKFATHNICFPSHTEYCVIL